MYNYLKIPSLYCQIQEQYIFHFLQDTESVIKIFLLVIR